MSDQNKTILVIDDDPIIGTLLKANFEKKGYRVITALNGQEGLKLYKINKPDIIILDIMMPQMDGYSFVQEFKAIGNLQETPIIILSAKDSMQDIFAIEGINDYILKPFQMEHLIAKIEKHLNSPRKKILVVDDAVEVGDLMETILKGRGYDVQRAADGIRGLALAQKEAPDLMILDIMMPKLDGYHVCRMFKYDQRYKNIPVVMLSAKMEEGDKSLGLQVGANVYLLKPFSGETLLQSMKELLWD